MLIQQIKANAKKNTKFISYTNHNLKITESCLNKITQFQEKFPDKLIRIVIDGGGCQGFQYKFEEDLCSNIGQTSKDTVLTDSKEEKPLIVFDLFSEFYIKDSTIEYENTLLFQGFSIKNNPKVKSTCGCKKSFSTDEFFIDNES